MASVPQSIAYLEQRLSGGAANADPDASLGGVMSSERILAQSTTALSNVTGVVIDYAGGNPAGAGSLAFDFSDGTLTWTPNGLDAGDPVDVNDATGRYAIFGEQGVLLVTVTTGSLAGSDKTDAVTIAYIANEQFDDVTKGESFAGDSEYRCFYVENAYSGSVTSITRSGGTAHVTTAANHGYVSGDEISHRGAVQPEYNVSEVITVIDANEYEYPVSGAPATPATGAIFHGKQMLSVEVYIATQPDPGTVSVGVDAAGVGDGATKTVSSLTRASATVTATTAAPHSYETGQTVTIAGATQSEYNGVQTITVTGASTFTYAIAGTPVTPATGSPTVSRGVAVTVADENTAPVGVTFSEPDEVGVALVLAALRPGESVAFWKRRVIPQRNTTTNAETLDQLSFAVFS
jgi:hypothetical protein